MPETKTRLPLADGLALTLAMTFPAVMAWFYFVAQPAQGDSAGSLVPLVFGAGKFLQFAFPLAYVLLIAREQLVWARPNNRGMAQGIGFGLLVVASMFGLYFLALKDSPVLAKTPGQVQAWLVKMKLDTPGGFFAMAAFVSVLHSFLEEYYWRWFVFGRLKHYLPLGAAIVLSALGFMAHHVIVLGVYLPGYFWQAAVPFSLAVAIGGGVWAWLYSQSRSLYAPWVSHLIVDLGIMVLGYDMLKNYW